MATVLIDSYSEANQSSGKVISLVSSTQYQTHAAQSFSCTYGITLDSCKFYVKKTDFGNATQPTYAKLYAHTGTYGTSSVPSGKNTQLAISDSVSVDSIGEDYSLITYAFSGDNRITLSSSSYYIIAFYFAVVNTDEDVIIIGTDFSSPTHSGNFSTYSQAGYVADSSQDLCFYVYGSSAAPTVTTQSCTTVTYNSATGNGNVTAPGGVAITRRGFCYKAGTSGDPTVSDSVVYDDGTFNSGAYTKAITGLSASTGYRVRAYAINSVGTSYGTTVQLTTSNADGPAVSSTTTSMLRRKVAQIGGNVTGEGTESVTERGVYYGTDEFTQATKSASGSGSGAYSITLRGLTPATTYYFKAFATSSIGTSYGDVLHFTTGNSLTAKDIAYLPPFNSP